MSWQDKTHRRIAELSTAAWRRANFKKNGQRYKRHRPYTIPEEARALVDCLNHNDEERAKSIMMFGLIGRLD